MSGVPSAVFLHGWCGHGDEAEHLQAALPGPLLAPSWMPAPGSIDLDSWPAASEPAAGMAMGAAMAEVGHQIRLQVRQSILQAGFAGSLLIGHSMGGALACLLAADPAVAARGLVLLDSSVPMPPQRRADTLVRMGQWIRRARTEGRTATQAAWVGDQPNRTDHFFHASEQGPLRERIERRMAHAPVVEAAATLGGYVQWPIDEAVMQLTCPVLAFAADPGRLPVAALRQARPDFTLKIVPACGHFVHVFAGELVRAQLACWLQAHVLTPVP
jgi:pimeloyl-ACP methyl ester carboxylesterase